MGKGLLMLVTATLIGGTIAWSQINRTNLETTDRQSERQEEILAREIARSGLSMTVGLMREDERTHPDSTTTMQLRVDRVNGPDGMVTAEYKGGRYEATAERVSLNAFAVESHGYYGDAHAVVRLGYDSPASGVVPKEVLEVKEPSTIHVEFIKSIAGYCSAIFLQRYVPTEGGQYQALDPEMLFVAGHNRDGEGMEYKSVELQPGERLNFILGVNQSCSLNPLHKNAHADVIQSEGQVKSDDDRFNYLHNALEEGVEELDAMREGKYALIERSEYNSNQYRIAFEDQNHFGDEQFADIKKNGYGNEHWRNTGTRYNPNWTYGGTGWNVDPSTSPHNYRRLHDFGNQPDFSDQVITVTMIPTATS